MSNNLIHINVKSAVPKYRQVVDAITSAIEERRLSVGDKLPSISQLCIDNTLKRDTVMYALNELKSRGIVSSQQGKGYYVCSSDIKINERYFLLFDELNAYSAAIFNTLVALLPQNASADIFFHHNDAIRIREFLTQRNGSYTSYILASAGLEEYGGFLQKLPGQNTCLIGQNNNGQVSNHCVFHDYSKDMYESLRSMRRSLKKYCRLVYMCINKDDYPGRTDGFIRFCMEEKFEYHICKHPESLRPALYEAYFVPEDVVLIKLMHQIRNSDFIVGENVGIVSFGDSAMKEIAEGGLTTLTPDFTDMCKRMIEITQGQKRGQFRTRSKIILRNSL